MRCLLDEAEALEGAFPKDKAVTTVASWIRVGLGLAMVPAGAAAARPLLEKGIAGIPSGDAIPEADMVLIPSPADLPTQWPGTSCSSNSISPSPRERVTLSSRCSSSWVARATPQVVVETVCRPRRR